MTDETVYLTTAEAAAIIRTSVEYVQRQCNNKALKAKKVGVEWRITEANLKAFMAGDEPAPPTRVRTARQERKSA